MHAIWFSIFVPVLAAAVWIWPKLRSAKVWLVLFGVALLATALWVGNDLIHFVDVKKGSMENVGVRTLYLFLSEPDIPAPQLIFGFLVAALFSAFLVGPSDEPKVGEETAADAGEG